MSPFILFLLAGSQTIIATEIWEINLSAKINASAHQVWPYLADFCNYYKIYPSSISFCEKGTTPGLFRYSVQIAKSTTAPNATVLVGWEREELIDISATKRYVAYDILENTFGIVTLKPSIMQVVPHGKNACIFKWYILDAPIPGVTYEWLVSYQKMRLSGIVSNIENLIWSV